MAKNQAAFDALLRRIQRNDLEPGDTYFAAWSASVKYGLTSGGGRKQILDLKNRGLTVSDMKALCEVLSTNIHITSLDISGNQITDEGFQYLIEALRKNKTLTHLDIEDNKITDDKAEALNRMLEAEENTSLTFLELGNRVHLSEYVSTIEYNICQPIHDRIEDMLARNRWLTLLKCSSTHELKSIYLNKQGVVYLGNMEINATRLKTILEKFSTHNISITGLDLYCNNIEDEEFKSIVKLLQNNPPLKYLIFTQNKIGYEGVKALVQFLQSNQSLKYLNLEFNNIKDKGLATLAKGLKNNDTLEILDLEGNRIEDEGIIALVGSLANNSTLKMLNLKQNRIGDKGAEALADMLEINTTLTTLDIDIDNKTILRRIEGYLYRNQSLAAEREKAAQTQATIQKQSEEIQHLKTQQAEQEKAFKEQLEILKQQQEAAHTSQMETLEAQMAGLTRKQSAQWKVLEKRFKKLMEERIKREIQCLKDIGNKADLEAQQILLAGGVTPASDNEIQEKIEQMNLFMERHAATLAEISREHKEKVFEDARLDAALKSPEAQRYYHTLVSEMNRLYMAASIASTGYFTPEVKGNEKMLRDLLNSIGKLVPGFGGYFQAAATVVNETSLYFLQKRLKVLADIASSPGDMERIITGVVGQLVIQQQRGPLNEELAREHLAQMTRAIFDGKLEDRKDVNIVTRILLDAVAEGNAIAMTSGLQPGLRRPKKNLNWFKRNAKASLNNIKKMITIRSRRTRKNVEASVRNSGTVPGDVIPQMTASSTRQSRISTNTLPGGHSSKKRKKTPVVA